MTHAKHSDTPSGSEGKVSDAGGIRAAVWRWHLYAGLFTGPFLILLGVTGAIYLFEDCIHDNLHRDVVFIDGPQSVYLDASLLLTAALATHPGASWSSYTPPPEPGRAARVGLDLPGGGTLDVYVDPRNGAPLGELDPSRSFLAQVRQLHSLSIAGPYASGLIEATAGWVVLLAVSGIALAWPIRIRGRLRTSVVRRKFWRDAHVVCGLSAGAVLVFLAITGLPWSGVWGTAYKSISRAIGQGPPVHIWDSRPQSARPEGDIVSEAWALSQQSTPASAAAAVSTIDIDSVIAKLTQADLSDAYVLQAPWGPTGVYTAMCLPDRPSGQRVIHIDQYSGELVEDLTLADFGTLARFTEWGISIHQGKAFGVLNQAIMLLGCLAAILMPLTGAVMWWKRRPSGAKPDSVPAEDVSIRTTVLLVVLASAVFPLTAVSMLPMLVVDFALGRIRPHGLGKGY